MICKIPTKRKIINAFLEENYLGKNIKIYIGRGIVGGTVNNSEIDPRYFTQTITDVKDFHSFISESEEYIVKINKIEWVTGLAYRVFFNPVMFKDHRVERVILGKTFELI